MTPFRQSTLLEAPQQDIQYQYTASRAEDLARDHALEDAATAAAPEDAPDWINFATAGTLAWMRLYRESVAIDSPTRRFTKDMAIFEQHYIGAYAREYREAYIQIMHNRRRGKWIASQLTAAAS